MANPKDEVLQPEPRGYLRDWNHNLDQMPEGEMIEVLRIHRGVERHDADSLMVVEPYSGRAFRPVAWRRIIPGKR
jgi:hypothetical protein